MSDAFRDTSKRLGELLLRGWTMLQDVCEAPKCNCPLMRSPDGQKYCVYCETWVYPDKKPESKKYTELFSTKSQINKEIKKEEIKKEQKQEIKKEEKKDEIKEQIKENVKEEEKKEKQNVEINKNGSLVELMENKLNILGKQLYEENDIQKCENIVQLMNKIIDTLERYKKVH